MVGRKRGAEDPDDPRALPPAVRRRMEAMQARIAELEAEQQHQVAPQEQPRPSTSREQPRHPPNVRIQAVAGTSGQGGTAHGALHVQAVAPMVQRESRPQQYPRIIGLPPHDPATLSWHHPGYIVETAPGAIRLMEATAVVRSERLLRALQEYNRTLTSKSRNCRNIIGKASNRNEQRCR